MSEATRILNCVSHGDSKAADELFPLVYRELRRLAASKMASEQAGQTLQPTALVHEAWLRLVGSGNPEFDGRGHFFAAAAEAMRRILIERARRKQTAKRGAGFERLDLEHADIAIHASDETLLVVNDALDKLAAEDPQVAELVNLRFFAGMTNEEAAGALGISVRTAKRHWTFARAWLYDEIRRATSSG
jgi:RNA polymerase sigma factor (TIGR02999 family)